MKRMARTLVAAAALIAASVQAEGLYVGGSFGPSHIKGDDVGGLAITDHSATGIKLYGGYSFTPNIAVEGGYVDFGKFGNSAGHLKANGVFVDAVGTWPIVDKFSLLGRVGLIHAKLDGSDIGSDRGTSVKVGAGVQYDIDQNFAIRGEAEHYRLDALGSKPSTNLYSIGVNYKF